MSTEQTQSIEDMLDGVEDQVSQPETLETGDNQANAAPPADVQPQAEAQSDAPHVPRRALEDERKKRQEAERRLGELERQFTQPQRQPQAQPQGMPAEPPDMFADPQGYTQWVTHQASVQAYQHAIFMMHNQNVNKSERRARKAHGDELVDAAMNAAERAGVKHQFIEADDPYEELVGWFGKYQIAADPEAARAKIEAEILAKHGITPAGQDNRQSRQPVSTKPQVPRSLASTASAQPRDSIGRFAGPTPLEDLLP